MGVGRKHNRPFGKKCALNVTSLMIWARKKINGRAREWKEKIQAIVFWGNRDKGRRGDGETREMGVTFQDELEQGI